MNPPSATGPYGSGYWGYPWRTASWSAGTFRRLNSVGRSACPIVAVSATACWEVRSDLTDGKIGRVIFCVTRERMVLLHSFVKRTQKTPARDLRLALKRMREVL